MQRLNNIHLKCLNASNVRRNIVLAALLAVMHPRVSFPFNVINYLLFNGERLTDLYEFNEICGG